jgi:RNA polymerase sigma-70 factor (ECF subfamily)
MNEEVLEALRSFYVGHRQQLFTYAVSITRNRESAEDAIHQVFQRLLRRTSLPVAMRPFVFRCVRNEALDDLRRTRVRSASVFEEDTTPGPAGAPGQRALLPGELEEALQALSPDEREVIALRMNDALTFQEIADLRGVPLPTVASWHRRGLEKMRERMARENP